MSATLKLVQVNIERSKHLDLVIPFLLQQNADVITMQELMERDVEQFEKSLGMKCFYAKMCMHPAEGNGGVMGNGIFSKYPVLEEQNIYYHQSDNPIVVHTEGVPGTTANAVTVCDIEKEGEIFRVATTHFTVALNGSPNDLQRDHVQKMFKILDQQGEFVFTGDFNASRGGEIFSLIAEKYIDNVPPQYVLSLDPTMHRAGAEKLAADAKAAGIPGQMVDGIFSTPGYRVSNVVMLGGVSDHCAFVAEISKA